MANQSDNVSGISAVLEYLESNPVMHQALQRYIDGVNERENELRQRLETIHEWLQIFEATLDNAERGIRPRMEERENPAPQESEIDPAPRESEINPAPQESEINEEEAALAPLPDDSEDQVPSQERAELAMQDFEVAGTSMEVDEEPRMEMRELELRNRTVYVPFVASQRAATNAVPAAFRAADIDALPNHFKKEVVQSSQDAYRVVAEDGYSYFACCMCDKRFSSLKGWRIHASKIHRKNGFCSSCGHFLALPSIFTPSQMEAAVEVHVLDWCPRARAPIMNERKHKRRRLEMIGKNEYARQLFVPGS